MFVFSTFVNFCHPPLLLTSTARFSFPSAWDPSPPYPLPKTVPWVTSLSCLISTKVYLPASSSLGACVPWREHSLIWESDRPGLTFWLGYLLIVRTWVKYLTLLSISMFISKLGITTEIPNKVVVRIKTQHIWRGWYDTWKRVGFSKWEIS